MCKKTKQTFIVAIIIAFLSLGGSLFLLHEIKEQGLSLEENVAILNENNDKEVAYTNINKLTKETEQERHNIENIFLQDEDQGLDLVNEIETLAPSLGLSLKTKDLGNFEDKEKRVESVVMSFVYFGKKSSVIAFTKLMENIPYHSSVQALSLKDLGSGNFEGEITIHITIKPS